MPESAAVLMQQLHDEHAAALWGYCLRLTGQDHARAEDVVQETLLRAWRNYDRLDESRGSVRAWLFTVARNIVIDEWRSKRAQSELSVADVPEARDARGGRRHRPAVALLDRRRGGHQPVGRPPGRAARVLLPRGVGRPGRPPARDPRGHREVTHALRPAGAAPGSPGDGGGRMTCEHAHLDGAYVLGALSPSERLDFERHLAGCAECSRSVRELAGLPGLLAQVDVGDLEPAAVPPLPPTLLPSLVREVRGSQRRRSVLVAAVGSVGGRGGRGCARRGRGVRRPRADGGPTPSPTVRDRHAAPARPCSPSARPRCAPTCCVSAVAWGTRLDLMLLVRGRRRTTTRRHRPGSTPSSSAPATGRTSRSRRGAGCRAARCACRPRPPRAGATSRRSSCGRPTGSSSSGCRSDRPGCPSGPRRQTRACDRLGRRARHPRLTQEHQAADDAHDLRGRRGQHPPTGPRLVDAEQAHRGRDDERPEGARPEPGDEERRHPVPPRRAAGPR